jgi:predicted metal-dependent HD superfamily phosphohydrolase
VNGASRERLVAAAPPELELSEELWGELERRYREPQRHYHNLTHLEDFAAEFASLRAEGAWAHPREVFLALLAHDVIYDPARRDNEALSAVWARERFGSFTVDLSRVVSLIELTARHGAVGAEGLDEDARLFLDADMAVLGSAAERYGRYERAIAAEYRPFVGGEAYRVGRARFLRGVLEATEIYLSRRFRERLEGAARQNLARALAALEGGGAGVNRGA